MAIGSNDIQKQAEELGVKYVEKINLSKIGKDTIRIIPEETARRYKMVPIGKEGDHIQVIMEDPRNMEALNVLRFLAKKETLQFEVFLAPEKIVNSALSLYESAEKALETAKKTLDDETAKITEEEQKLEQEFFSGKKAFQDAPVSKLVNVIIRHAVAGKASDIHIEPVDTEYRARYRVDGILHSSLSIPKNVGKAVVARIKILSNLKIDEKRKPQDGRFRIEEGGNPIDFRVSTFPVIEGEKVVMRVLDRNSGLASLDDLGLMGNSRDIFERRIRDPYGIILITGPTGSGKSTTLYSFLRILNQETTNIVTLEDPVEYYIEGINQSQINPAIGYTFASGLRSILRQDPNIIMVGEIRDAETAELAVHSALTGHLVFSTLHTNSAIGAIPRLVDMGTEGFLLAASVHVVAAQRLVRRLCTQCRQEVQIPEAMQQRVREELAQVDEEEAKKYDISLQEKLVFQRGSGCEACGNSGYKGRVAIYEVFEMTNKMQDIISGQGNVAGEMEKEAKNQGMITLKQDGLLKALQGLTTLSEVERITEGNFDTKEDAEGIQ